MAKSFFRRISKKFFIVANIITSLLFLAGCYAKWLPGNWWFIGLLTMSAFYLLIVLLVFLLFWLFAKRIWTLITILTLLLAFGPLTNIIPFRFSQGFTKAKVVSAMRVMDWNVEHFDILEHKTHPEVKQQMIDLVNEYQPDIACFQEMVGSDKEPKAINYIPDMMQQFGFTDYNYSYNVKIDFDGNHHFGVLTFSRYPILNKQTVSFPPHDYNSIFQYTDILKESDTVRVFNIHLQSMKFDTSSLSYINNPSMKDQRDIVKSKWVISKLKMGLLKRAVQADRIAEEIAKSPYPVLVCGDFNDVPNSYAYGTIGKGLNNAFEKKGSGLGRTFSGISPTLRIDNIFADKRMKILQYTRIKKKLSDHFPILADVLLNK